MAWEWFLKLTYLSTPSFVTNRVTLLDRSNTLVTYGRQSAVICLKLFIYILLTPAGSSLLISRNSVIFTLGYSSIHHGHRQGVSARVVGIVFVCDVSLNVVCQSCRCGKPNILQIYPALLPIDIEVGLIKNLTSQWRTS